MYVAISNATAANVTKYFQFGIIEQITEFINM